MSELDDRSLQETASFITQNEQENITLSSLFHKDGTCAMPSVAKFKVFLFRSDDIAETQTNANTTATKQDFQPSPCHTKLKGVVSVSSCGQILHCLKFTSQAEKNEFCKLLAAEIPHEQIFCVLGEKNGSDLIASAINRKSCEVRSYTLMYYKGSSKLMPPSSLALTRCDTEHVDLLFTLQKNYELVEVLLDAADFDEFSCRLNLRKLLREQTIYALLTDSSAKIKQKAVAKAGTNAKGLNWYQLGGVYTLPEYRNHGCAAFLTQFLAEKLREQGKKTALFVNDKNIFAQKAYEKAGFVKDKPFEIIYY